MQSEIWRELHSGWQFRAVDPLLGRAANISAEHGWQPATVPGTVYQDLIAQGSIPDPFVGMNEQDVQWVAKRDWCYRLDFEADPATLAHHTDLVFEGLDTFAQVWLNERLILTSDNMFVPARVAVADCLRPGTNQLIIVFESALRRGQELEALFGKRHLWNGDSSRLYVRKAQYHYGWDWGPILLTAGPWKPVTLHSYDVRITTLDTPVQIDLATQRARIDVATHLAGQWAADTVIEHTLFDPHGQQIACTTSPACTPHTQTLHIDNAQLWWPAGHGTQPLYRLKSVVLCGDKVLARTQHQIGLRTIQLVQEAVTGEPGSSFYFKVNDKEIFTGGANWIPDDNLLNRITPERYRERIQQAVAGNMIMLRVWAGGIYEDDAFYAACDELGVLVWQDFLFACGIYPAYPDFLTSVRAEAEVAVLRLRHHASLALWCGNNEDYAIAESVGLYGTAKDMARFEARAIYEQLLPEMCARLDPTRPYWPGSPYSPSATATLSSADPTIGDRHSWEVWHGAMLPYQDYHKVQARFVSEFGMQSHPSLAALETVIPEAERFALSRSMSWHNKAGNGTPDGHRRLAVYLADTLNVGPTLADNVYATQFVQAESMRYAYQDFRRRWQHQGARAVGGALVWQLNDCWPVSSWAIIDSIGSTKPAWHSIRRALAPLAVAVRLHAQQAHGWVMSSHTQAMRLQLRIQTFTLDGTLVHEAEKALETRGNGTTEFDFALPAHSTPLLAQVNVHSASGETLASDTAWPEPFRFYPLPPAGLHAERDVHADCIHLHAERPCKGIWLSAPGLGFADNFIDLVPGQTACINMTGDVHTPIHIQALDQAALMI
ncbi:beta-mannosidase [Uliginosibacterium gangwonense]|uniref:beta-mannosidase n=1 Tax=Uliginosibacterium gangwonense TaxID=392736 RepID=UPI00037168E2|nr:glycoside hydrolase family 2 protein [Uliginosibacterium gangwonense]